MFEAVQGIVVDERTHRPKKGDGLARQMHHGADTQTSPEGNR
jgi:hypothetical protein